MNDNSKQKDCVKKNKMSYYSIIMDIKDGSAVFKDPTGNPLKKIKDKKDLDTLSVGTINKFNAVILYMPCEVQEGTQGCVWIFSEKSRKFLSTDQSEFLILDIKVQNGKIKKMLDGEGNPIKDASEEQIEMLLDSRVKKFDPLIFSHHASPGCGWIYYNGRWYWVCD